MADIYIGQPQRTRSLGELALQQGAQGGAVYHPMQALGQLAQTAAGMYLVNKADEQERQRRSQANDALMALMGGGGGPTAMAGTSPMAMSGGNIAALLSTVSEYPELAGAVNPMIAAQMTPQKRRIETDVAGRKRFVDTGELAFPEAEAPQPKFSTDYGKAMADVALAEQTYGKDSQQAEAFREMAQRERTGAGEIDLSDESGQRKEFTKASGDFVAVRDAFGKVQRSQGTAAGDLAMIFNFMKMLDPGSVVREGEFATAQNTAGVPERLRNTYNRLLTGERLSAEQRSSFKDQAGEVFASQKEQQDLLEGEFRRIATASGLRPDNVIVDFQGEFRDYAPSPASAGEQPPALPAAPGASPQNVPPGAAPFVSNMGAAPQGFAATAVNPETGEVLVWNGTEWVPQ